MTKKASHKNDQKRKYLLRKQYHKAVNEYFASRYLVEVPPYQQGWARFGVLETSRIPQKFNVGLAHKAFDRVNHTQIWYNKEFLIRKGVSLHYRLLRLVRLPSDEALHPFFVEVQQFNYAKPHMLSTFYQFAFLEWVDIVVEPNIITHEIRYNAEKKSAMDRLHNKLRATGDYYRMYETGRDEYYINARQRLCNNFSPEHYDDDE